ncbi:MAG TPA: histidine--tRNA ligase [Capsulimonadaceae bacterium]|nr:histidine--tRNA ligase [Capsulimonadaceae bacterium]
MPKYSAPKYTHDVFPDAQNWEENSEYWEFLEEAFRDLCRLYDYRRVQTPIFEQTELFTRAVGEGTDIVSKEMFTFEDKAGRSMTLRPEGTAGAIRAYIEDGLYAQGGVQKYWYIGPNFRYERGQKGRYRQHMQCGLEAIGSQDPALDAEVIQLAMAFYRRIGIERLTLKINSVGCQECRPKHREALLVFAKPFLEEMSADNQRRFRENPLRMLDSKDERDQQLLANAPALIDFLCDECRTHFEALKGCLDLLGIPYELDPKLVRGFDYYTKTAFEVQSPDLGAQSTLCGGGRYDGLVEELGGQAAPAVGCGMGIERALIALQSLGRPLPVCAGPTAFLVTLGDDARNAGFKLLFELREAGVSADMDFGGKSMKAQMRAADKASARFALIFGENELATGVAQCKDLKSGTQEEVAISSLAEHLKSAEGQA